MISSPGLQERRRERQMLDALAAEQAHHRTLAAGLPRDIDIFGAGLLQGQANKFAASLDPGPIIELIPHAARS